MPQPKRKDSPFALNSLVELVILSEVFPPESKESDKCKKQAKKSDIEELKSKFNNKLKLPVKTSKVLRVLKVKSQT